MGEDGSKRARRLRGSAAADRRLANDFELTGHVEYARYLRRCAEEAEFELQVLEQVDGKGKDAPGGRAR